MPNALESLGQLFQNSLPKGTDPESSKQYLTLFLLIDAFYKFLDELPGSSITQVPQTFAETLRVANRMCRFVLGGQTVIGTGFLVGPSHVLTAAHLFYEAGESGKGRVIDPDRATSIGVEFDTMLMGSYLTASGNPRIVELHDDWAVDPKVNGSSAHREVEVLDFAVVRLREPVGEESIGGGKARQWFEIPEPANVATVARSSMIHIFQYLDRGRLRSSIGSIKGINPARTRMFYGASTLDAASGSAVLDDQLRLVGVHVGGEDEDHPLANQGLPLHRIARYLEDQGTRTNISPPIPVE